MSKSITNSTYGANTKICFFLFLLLMGIYFSNAGFNASNDARGNVILAINLIYNKSFHINPKDFPDEFIWGLRTSDGGLKHLNISKWRGNISNISLDELYNNHLLFPVEGKYYITKSVLKDRFVNMFGFGSAISALPVFIVLDIFVDNLKSNVYWQWYGGKLVASIYVSATAILIFLIAMRFTSKELSLLVSLSYGLGTCVWSTSSQALWQHASTSFFLTLGIFYLLRRPLSIKSAMLCASSLSMATFCRPQSVVVAVCVGIYYLFTNRKHFYYYVLLGLPYALFLFIYNGYYFGDIFRFGQEIAAEKIGLATAGASSIWQTPVFSGLAGILFSPSRGLFVYSPFLIFSLLGIAVLKKLPYHKEFYPLVASLVIMLLLHSKWFVWWGGWSYGYRIIVDTVPLLTVLLIPAIRKISQNKFIFVIFSLTIIWSVYVQILGAYAYNVFGWNDKNNMDIDRQKYHYRLWSVTDSQISFYTTHFGESRQLKQDYISKLVTSR